MLPQGQILKTIRGIRMTASMQQLAAVLGFGGLRIKNGIAGFDPWLPEKWKSLSYKVMWKNEIISCHITKKYLKVMITGSDNVSYKISICGQIHTINANSELIRFFENTEG